MTTPAARWLEIEQAASALGMTPDAVRHRIYRRSEWQQGVQWARMRTVRTRNADGYPPTFAASHLMRIEVGCASSTCRIALALRIRRQCPLISYLS